jgi:hypothetical protein
MELLSILVFHPESLPLVGEWQGVAMDYLKFHLGLACPIHLSPAGGPPLKRPYSRFRGGPPAEVAGTQGRLPAAISTLLDTPRRTPILLSPGKFPPFSSDSKCVQNGIQYGSCFKGFAKPNLSTPSLD